MKPTRISAISTLLVVVVAPQSLAQCPTAEFELTSTQAGLVVDPGTIVDWYITIEVSAGDNEGLTVFSVDFVQDVLNPEKFDLPPASIPAPPDVMAGFTRPDGICNPGPGGSGSGYGGTQIGEAGQMDLRQIGGAQNTMGIIGSAMGLDITIDPGIGQAGAQLVADGWFSAPSTPGCYTFTLQDAVAKVLDLIDPDPTPPAHWPIRQAMVQFAERSFSFSVSGGTPCQGACCKADGTCLLTTEEDCEVQEGFYQGHYSTCLHAGCEVTGACCRGDGTCSQMTCEECVPCCPLGACPCTCLGGGGYMGDASACSPDPCTPPPTGACCLAEGTCLPERTTLECASADGVYLGDSTPCDPGSCEGACCIDELTCNEGQTENECVTEGGNYQGHGTDCTEMDCTAGACCLSVDICLEATEMSCDYEGGLYEGDGTDCSSTFCENCADGGAAVRCPAKEFNKLTADDAAAEDRFGHSVAIEGMVAVVGSPEGDSTVPAVSGSGCVYVTYRYDNDNCIEEVKISAPDAATDDEFGTAVAIAGDFIVVGAPKDDDNGGNSGSAYVFKYSEGTWEPDGPELHARFGESGDRFGLSAAISGDGTVAVIGARLADPDSAPGNAGRAYVFRRYEDNHTCVVNEDCVEIGLTKCNKDKFCDGVAWVEEAELVASDEAQHALFGSNVDIDYDADTIVVGAPKALAQPPPPQPLEDFFGQAYVFEYALGSWAEKAILIPVDPMLNDKESVMPMPVSITDAGDVVLVGEPWNDGTGECNGTALCDSGAAYVYKEPGGGWSGVVNEDARITSCDLAMYDRFGWSVSISALGDVALVGAPRAGDEADIGGAAYAFRFNGSSWYEEAKFTAAHQTYSNDFGFSTALSDDTGLIGAPRDDHAGQDSGGAYIFRGVGDCDATDSLDICEILADPSVDFPLAHNCCETGHGVGCSDEVIEGCVCSTGPNPDPYCCETYWDAVCAGLVDPDCASCGEGNGIPYACEDCPADFDGNDDVGPFDLATLLGAWGPCTGTCPEDLSGDCEVGPHDLAILLGSWGPCPQTLRGGASSGPTGALRFALGGGNGCLPLEEAVQMLGFDGIDEFIEWVLSEVPPEWVYQVAQFLLWLMNHWPC